MTKKEKDIIERIIKKWENEANYYREQEQKYAEKGYHDSSTFNKCMAMIYESHIDELRKELI